MSHLARRLLGLVMFLGACQSTTPPRAETASPGASKPDPEFDTLCAGVPPEQQAKCPIGAWAQSADDVEGGVVLHLNASAPPPSETQRRMRCHRAWMAHDPANAMPRCPLGAPGITISASAGTAGTDLSLIATAPENVQEVRRRTHAALGK
jgi:hypothetical protein